MAAMKAFFIGAGTAAVLGLMIGSAAKVPLDQQAAPGQQQLIPSPMRSPSAFDAWYPSEGAPPPPLESDALYAPTERDVEDQLAALSVFNRPSGSARAQPVASPATPAAPEPYLPSAQGDILAPSPYEPIAFPEPVREVPAPSTPSPEPRDLASAGDTSASKVDIAALAQ